MTSEEVEQPSQSISCSRSFGHPVIEMKDLSESVAVYTEQAATKLRKQQQKASGGPMSTSSLSGGGMAQEGGTTGTAVIFDFQTNDTGAILNNTVLQ